VAGVVMETRMEWECYNTDDCFPYRLFSCSRCFLSLSLTRLDMSVVDRLSVHNWFTERQGERYNL